MSVILSNPEYIQNPEVEERALESLDLTHEMERILTIIIESGPELDPDYLVFLNRYLDDLYKRLDFPLKYQVQSLKDLKIGMGVDDDKVTEILVEHSLPDILRVVIEKIVAGMNEGLTEKAIYHRLARIYHPDQTTLHPEEAEYVFKLIGELLYDENGGFSKILTSTG